MQFRFLVFLLSLVTTTAFPLEQESTSTWTIQGENSNLAIDKSDVSKTFNGMWKSHVESNDLYSQDTLNPMAADLRHKLSQESERLRSRLKQELLELRQRLSPYPTHPQLTPANIRELLFPFIKHLQEALNSNTKNMCDLLVMILQGLHPDVSSLDEKTVVKISETLNESHHRRTAAFEEFKSKAYEAVEKEQDSSRKELWEEVTASLGQEILSFSLAVQGKVAALKVSLATLLTSSEPQRSELISKVEQFRQMSSTQNQRFIGNLEQLVAALEQKQSQGDPSSQVSIDSIQEDFSTRLNVLLQDIVHSLN